MASDHKGNEMNIAYRGEIQFETKEGETVIVTGYLPDADNRTNMIAIEYVTNHGMEAEKWESKQ